MIIKRLLIFLTGAAFLAGSAHAALTAHWDFEGNVTDSVSSTAGTLNGAAATDGAAIAPTGSNSLNLPSSSPVSYLDTNTNGGLGGTGSFTVFAFIQTTSTSNGTIFNYSPTGGSTGGGALRLFAQGNGDFRVEMSAGAGFNLTSVNLNDGNTHAIAAVFNSSTGNSFLDIDLYVDGTLYDVTSGTDHTVDLITTGSFSPNVQMGIDHVSAENRPFVGLIDDVSIYDEALSLSSLNALTVPEPSSTALLGLGGLALILRRRR